MLWSIYVLRSQTTGEVRYVGITTNEEMRKYQHSLKATARKSAGARRAVIALGPDCEFAVVLRGIDGQATALRLEQQMVQELVGKGHRVENADRRKKRSGPAPSAWGGDQP